MATLCHVNVIRSHRTVILALTILIADLRRRVLVIPHTHSYTFRPRRPVSNQWCILRNDGQLKATRVAISRGDFKTQKYTDVEIFAVFLYVLDSVVHRD